CTDPGLASVADAAARPADAHRDRRTGRDTAAEAAAMVCAAVEVSRHVSSGFLDEVRARRYLRNVIAHPAKLPVTTGETSVAESCFRMERDPEFWAFAAELPAHSRMRCDDDGSRRRRRRTTSTMRLIVSGAPDAAPVPQQPPRYGRAGGPGVGG